MEAIPRRDLEQEKLNDLKKDFGHMIGKKTPFDVGIFKALEDNRVEKVEVSKIKVGDKISIKDVEGEVLAISINNELKIKTVAGLIIRTKLEIKQYG